MSYFVQYMVKLADASFRYSQIWFGLYSMFPTWSDWNISYTRQGTLKRRRKAFFRSMLLLALFSGALRLGLNGQNWTSVKPLLMSCVKKALLISASTMQKIGETF